MIGQFHKNGFTSAYKGLRKIKETKKKISSETMYSTVRDFS